MSGRVPDVRDWACFANNGEHIVNAQGFCVNCGVDLSAAVIPEPFEGGVTYPRKPRTGGNKSLKTRVKKEHVIRDLMWRWGHRCWYCGKELINPDELPTPAEHGRLPSNYPTIDHLVPRSAGGSNHIDNLRLACPVCNNLKGDKPTNRPDHEPAWEPRAPSSACPRCDGTGRDTGTKRDKPGILCVWCDGRGRLTAEKATDLLNSEHRLVITRGKRLRELQAENKRLRSVIEEAYGHHAASRKNLASTVAGQAKTIAAMSDAILRMKVELAEVRGDDLTRTIPNAGARARALRLVHGDGG